MGHPETRRILLLRLRPRMRDTLRRLLFLLRGQLSQTISVNANNNGTTCTGNCIDPLEFLNDLVTSQYYLKLHQLQGSVPMGSQNQRIQQLAAQVTKDTNCAVNSLIKGGSTMAIDAVGVVPFGGEAEMAVPVAVNAVASANSAAQGDATGSGLATANMVQTATTTAAQSVYGDSLPKAIPVAGQFYSGALVFRDILNASGEYVNCF
jgi:hypothetical protein